VFRTPESHQELFARLDLFESNADLATPFECAPDFS
jgi:hypothetical protein